MREHTNIRCCPSWWSWHRRKRAGIDGSEPNGDASRIRVRQPSLSFHACAKIRGISDQPASSSCPRSTIHHSALFAEEDALLKAFLAEDLKQAFAETKDAPEAADQSSSSSTKNANDLIVLLTTGSFNPPHRYHIECLNLAYRHIEVRWPSTRAHTNVYFPALPAFRFLHFLPLLCSLISLCLTSSPIIIFSSKDAQAGSCGDGARGSELGRIRANEAAQQRDQLCPPQRDAASARRGDRYRHTQE